MLTSAIVFPNAKISLRSFFGSQDPSIGFGSWSGATYPGLPAPMWPGAVLLNVSFFESPKSQSRALSL